MSEFLASLVEWFAIITMSVMGIDYTPTASCDDIAPTEYRETVYSTADMSWVDAADGLIAADNCLSLRIHEDSETLPLFVDQAVIYKS